MLWSIVEGGSEAEAACRELALLYMGKEKIVYHSGHSSFSGIENPKLRLKEFK